MGYSLSSSIVSYYFMKMKSFSGHEKVGMGVHTTSIIAYTLIETTNKTERLFGTIGRCTAW